MNRSHETEEQECSSRVTRTLSTGVLWCPHPAQDCFYVCYTWLLIGELQWQCDNNCTSTLYYTHTRSSNTQHNQNQSLVLASTNCCSAQIVHHWFILTSSFLINTKLYITGSKSEVKDIGMQSLYPMRGTLDISRAKDLLEYQPQFSLRQGLESYYDWIRQHTS